MSEQIDLFFSKTDNIIPISSGWFISPSKNSTAENQSLLFDVPGIVSSYHAGQKSVWVLNGIDRSAFYADGDPERIPTKAVIELASVILIELTNAGKLFPESLERVIYMNAWEKGASAGFNDAPDSSNPYDPATLQYKAWLDGWIDNSSLLYE